MTMRLRLTLALLFSLSCAVSVVAAQWNPKPNPKYKALAIRNYQRAIELNPQNTNAIEMLKKLRAQ